MRDYESTMTQLEEMRSRFDDGFSISDRKVIESLYALVCSKTVKRSGCSDCYRDAYIEIFTTLKRNKSMPTKPNYVLKAGALVHPFGTSDFYVLGNIPDDVAEDWLISHPNEIGLFEKYPDDLEERLEARRNALNNSAQEDSSTEGEKPVDEEETATEDTVSQEEQKPTDEKKVVKNNLRNNILKK